MRKILFPLEMDCNVLARDIQDIRNNYNVNIMRDYFSFGKEKLLKWLKDRDYIEEYQAILQMKKYSDDTLYKIFKIDFFRDTVTYEPLIYMVDHELAKNLFNTIEINLRNFNFDNKLEEFSNNIQFKLKKIDIYKYKNKSKEELLNF